MFHPSITSRFPSARRVTAVALTLLLLVQTSGCTTWHPVTNSIPTHTSAKPSDMYRVTLVGGKVVQLTKLRVHGDSLLGMADSTKFVRGSLEAMPYPVSFPVDQVAQVERHSPATAATGIGVFALMLGVLVVGVFATQGSCAFYCE